MFLVVFILVFCFSLFFIAPVLAVKPFGANVTDFGNQTAPVADAQGHGAVAGNISELNIFGYSVTQSWQGYYGNVTRTIFLGDSDDNQLYNWSNSNPSGEVYSSTNGSIKWTNIQCFCINVCICYTKILPYKCRCCCNK